MSGVWDKTTPAGSDPIAEGDDRIRELKNALEEALSHEGVFPGASPSTTPIFIPTFLRDVTGSRPTGDSLVSGRVFFNTTTNVIERYNGATWDTIFTLPADAAIDENKLAASVAGSGLTGGAGSPLAVNVDNSTLEVNTDIVRVKDLGITTAKIAAAAVDSNKIASSVAGDGLSGGAGSALSVNVDGSTIETNSDSLRVKDAGITQAKLATAVVNQLGQNIGIVSIVTSAGTGTQVNYSGQGKLKGIGCTAGVTGTVVVTVDGVTIFSGTMATGDGLAWTSSGVGSSASGLLNSLEILFKTSLVVSIATSGTIKIAYERAA